VPTAEDAAAVIGVLETVAGGDGVESAMVIDPAAPSPSGVSLTVGEGVTFAIGSATIESTFLPILDRMATLMLEDPNISIVVEGHTDGTGDPVRNLALSQQRAEAVVDYIAEQGVNPFRLEPRGRGSTEPVADDSTAAGQARNRRIEFVVVGLPLGS
ncbi:MAG: OmpA family protein, partial [Actinomycetota bacterium]